jgi:hypothetical protein
MAEAVSRHVYGERAETLPSSARRRSSTARPSEICAVSQSE